MSRTLDGLKQHTKWVAELGCLQGCLRYLGIHCSDEWLYGATGHAFLMNIGASVCPSGPVTFRSDEMARTGEGLGYRFDTIRGTAWQDDLAETRRRAWQFVRTAIDDGNPCYCWELHIPDYYVINGYDGDDYLFNGVPPHPSGNRKPWNTLGESKIQIVDVRGVRKGEAASDAEVVKKGIAFALEFMEDGSPYRFDGYYAGVAAFDRWIEDVSSRKAMVVGVAYNAVVWHECRHHAVEFLREAATRVGKLDGAFEKTASHYETVSQNLSKLKTVFPFPPSKNFELTTDRVEISLAYLRNAREAERRAIDGLRKIAGQL